MDIDDTPLTFGQHKGTTPRDLWKHDPGYVVWMHANVTPTPCSRKLRDKAARRQRQLREEREDEFRYGLDD